MGLSLVTGGGGFLGRAIVEMLLAQEESVRVIARGQYPELAGLGVDCRQADLRNADAVSAVCQGVDIVYHVAALADVWGRRRDFFSVNVDGTDNVIAACRRHGVPRLVYTSSPSVVFGMSSLEGVDESQPYPQRFYAHYPESKAVAERRALAAADNGLATCALRPHLIWGPGDTHIVPLLASQAKAGKLIQVGDGSNLADMTYIDNAATAHLQAAAALTEGSPVNGQAYFIGDAAPVNMWEWINELLAHLELPPVRRSISYAAASRIGLAMEMVHTVLPFLGQPRLTRFLASQFATSHYFDHGKAKRDFGYDPQVSNAEGMRRTAAWYTGGMDRRIGDGAER